MNEPENEPEPAGHPRQSTRSSDARFPFPLIGIGASAGGIEAVSNLLQHLPADPGAALLVVLHLDPTRESHLADVLGKHSQMPVLQIEDRMTIDANNVYVIAPDKSLTIKDGHLRLTPPSQPRGFRRPVDELFLSLAWSAGERAAAVVMSGTGTNGSACLAEIKAHDGIVFAQDPATAKFDGMPSSAIDTGLVDQVLEPARLAEAIREYARAVSTMPVGSHEISERHFQEMLGLLRDHSQLDLRSYRRPTLARRMSRRMSIRGLHEPTDYLARLREDAGERAALTNDLMISVTSFFRDAESWEALAEQVIAPLLQSKDHRGEIRCWVPACSSGEEAYTLAILLAEQAEAAGKNVAVRIFATDLSASAVARARAGLYPDGIALHVSPERLQRYFTWEGSQYRINKSIRETVTLAPHNLLSDPPFSRLDLATCRNVLIYLEPEFQRKVLALLHFALRPGGALMLGSAESAERGSGYFQVLDAKHKIYRQVGSTPHEFARFPLVKGISGPPGTRSTGQQASANRGIATIAMTALANLAHAAVLLDGNQRVIYFHGASDLYLTHPHGRPTLDVYGMARPGLEAPIRSALGRARHDNETATAETVVERRSNPARVRVTATPLEDDLLLLSFQRLEDESARKRTSVQELAAAEGDKSSDLLREELRQSHLELARTVEDLERSNEELTASNEETMSINEELQSTNEELETSKEELHSLNEELATVNTQLQSKINELEITTNKLANLLKSSDIATLFLSRDLKVKWFTPAVGRLFSLIETDVGRPITDFAQKFVDGDFTEDSQQVLKTLVPTKTQVKDKDGHWYLRHTTPYRTGEDRIEGVVVTFVDISESKRAERRARRAAARARKAAAAKDDFLARLSHELRTPLQPALLGLSGLVDRRDMPDDMAEKIANVIRNIEIEIRLIDDLLDLTRVDHGKLRLRREPTDAVDLAQDTVRLCHDESTAKHQEVNVEGVPGQHWIYVDRIRMQQVIWNLLRNAIRFTREHGKVTIHCERRDERVEISVMDDGIGIPASMLPRIFDSFERSDSSFSGLGLGLSIARSLVEAHDGTIQAESGGRGRGSTFRVSLPAAASPGPEAQRDDAQSIKERGMASLSGLRVLVIEDHADSARVLSSLLQAAGARPRTAGTIKQALTVVREETFDVILSDLALPDGNAHDFIGKLPRKIPVIAVSGFGAPEDMDRSIELGFAEHLVKPVTLADLRDAIGRVLR